MDCGKSLYWHQLSCYMLWMKQLLPYSSRKRSDLQRSQKETLCWYAEGPWELCFHSNHKCFFWFLSHSCLASWVGLSYPSAYAQVLVYTTSRSRYNRHGNQMSWHYSHLLHDKFARRRWPCSLEVTEPDPWRMLTIEAMDISKSKSLQRQLRKLDDSLKWLRALPFMDKGYENQPLSDKKKKK